MIEPPFQHMATVCAPPRVPVTTTGLKPQLVTGKSVLVCVCLSICHSLCFSPAPTSGIADDRSEGTGQGVRRCRGSFCCLGDLGASVPQSIQLGGWMKVLPEPPTPVSLRKAPLSYRAPGETARGLLGQATCGLAHLSHLVAMNTSGQD